MLLSPLVWSPIDSSSGGGVSHRLDNRIGIGGGPAPAEFPQVAA